MRKKTDFLMAVFTYNSGCQQCRLNIIYVMFSFHTAFHRYRWLL